MKKLILILFLLPFSLMVNAQFDGQDTLHGAIGNFTGNFNIGGDVTANNLNPSEIANSTKVTDGIVIEKQDFFVTESGGTIYINIQKSGTGDLTVQFDNTDYTLDCTPIVQVALTAGADAENFQLNFVYVLNEGGVPVVTASTANPNSLGRGYAWLGVVTVFDATTTSNDGAFAIQRYNNSTTSPDTIGLLNRYGDRLRQEGAHWASGVSSTVTIDTEGAVKDSAFLDILDGIVYQLHSQGFTVTDTNSQGYPYFYIANHPTTPYIRTFNLGDIDVDALGVSTETNNARYGLEVIGVQNSGVTGALDRIIINLPSGIYSNDNTALTDANNYAVTSVAQDYHTVAFRICRVVLKYQVNLSGTLTNVVGGTGVQDRRGFSITGISGGGGIVQTSQFSDASFAVFDNGDATKEIAFQASGITTGNTRTLTVQDSDGTIAYLTDVTTPTLAQVLVEGSTTSGTNIIISDGDSLNFGASADSIALSSIDDDSFVISRKYEDINKTAIEFQDDYLSIETTNTAFVMAENKITSTASEVSTKGTAIFIDDAGVDSLSIISDGTAVHITSDENPINIGDADVNYTSFATDGAITLYGTAIKYKRLSAWAYNFYTSTDTYNGISMTTEPIFTSVNGAVVLRYMAHAFGGGNNNAGLLFTEFTLPSDYLDGGTIIVEADWCPFSTSSGDVKINTGILTIGDGESYDQTPTYSTPQVVAIPTTAYVKKATSFTFSGTGYEAGDDMWVCFYRDKEVGVDTYGSYLLLVNLCIKYQSNKWGE